MRIGAGVANGMDYLLTWNGTHIANAAIRGKIEHTCRRRGASAADHLHARGVDGGVETAVRLHKPNEETPNGKNTSND